MWSPNVFALLLLGSCGVLLLSSGPVAAEETTVKNDAEVTLSTELLPPPLPAAGEHRGIVYLINLFAVKNKTDENSEEKGENVLTNDSPEIIGPLASILLIVDDEDGEEVIYDEFPRGEIIEDDFQFKGIDAEAESKDLETESTIPDEPKSEEKPKKPKKIRRKRTLFKKKYNGGNGGSYNNYPTGGGGYNGYNPNGGGSGQTVVGIPIVILPVGVSGGGGRGYGGGQGRGHGGGNYNGGGGNYGQRPNGGGGNYGQHPSGGGYPSGGGGGYYPQGGGGGGGGSSSQAWAQASAGSSSNGR